MQLVVFERPANALNFKSVNANSAFDLVDLRRPLWGATFREAHPVGDMSHCDAGKKLRMIDSCCNPHRPGLVFGANAFYVLGRRFRRRQPRGSCNTIVVCFDDQRQRVYPVIIPDGQKPPLQHGPKGKMESIDACEWGVISRLRKEMFDALSAYQLAELTSCEFRPAVNPKDSYGLPILCVSDDFFA
jgi:hypothetical protein